MPPPDLSGGGFALGTGSIQRHAQYRGMGLRMVRICVGYAPPQIPRSRPADNHGGTLWAGVRASGHPACTFMSIGGVALDTRERVRSFLGERFLFDPAAAIDPVQSLMKAGILDSTGAMELVLFLEEEFSIRVADTELVPENLDSLNNIAAFVARKKATA